MWTNLPLAQRKDAELPKFYSLEAAERELFAMRDESLRWLSEFAHKRRRVLELEPKALEVLEDLYFEVWDGSIAARLRGGRKTFESAMGMFWGAVAVAQRRATWAVYESPFVQGHYGLSVTRQNSTVVVTNLGSGWDRRPRNKAHRRLRELYDQLIGTA